MRSFVIFNMSVLTVLLFGLNANSQSPSLSDAALKGSYNCKLTGYTLPATSTDPFTQTSSGDITLVADGAGHWTSGSWDDRIDSSDIHASCKFQLSSGTYSIGADGTGAIAEKWQLNVGASTPNCAQFSLGARDAPNVGQVIITDGTGATFYTASLNQFAVLAAICTR
ncbi:MAG TPA: hypothetical protein VMV27_15280 [Candidatus Binataceae bacterium]|nr:hypothetical protein [Candidatus Binataceae bacterium]